MKRWARTGVALATVAALALAGCGRDTGGGGGDDTAAPVGEGKATGEITVWAMGTEGEKLSAFAADFMKENPDATVKVTPIPWDGVHDKIATAIAGRQTPDMSMIGTTMMGEFARNGGLETLPEGLVTAGDFYPGAWDTNVVDGKAYGVPWYVETRLFYVNKDLAARAGVTTPPKTWEEFKAAIGALKQRAGAKWGISLLPGGTGSWQSVLPFVWQNGGDVTDGNKFTLDSPQVTEAIGYYESFFNDGLSPTDLQQGALEPDFVKGQIGAFISGPWHIALLNEQGGTGKFDLWPMPTRKSATSFVGGADLAVFKDAKNRDGAWKFISWLSRPEVQVKWYQLVNDLPAVKKSWDDPALAGDPLLSAFGAQLDDAKAPPTIPTWNEVAAAFDAEIEKLVKTDASAAATAAAIQQRVTSIGTGT